MIKPSKKTKRNNLPGTENIWDAVGEVEGLPTLPGGKALSNSSNS